MAIDLRGKPIAITGASSGIGLATAYACARAGMPVALAARRVDRLDAAAEKINREDGRAIAVACDVADAAQCRALIERTAGEFGSIYAVFANAGYGIEKPIAELSDAELRGIFEVNFFGTVNTIRPALERMLPAKSGHVLICSSCLSKLGMPLISSYSATKAAQDHIGRGMRVELTGSGVHVSTVHPIGTDTELGQVMREKAGNKDRSMAPPRAFMQSSGTVADAVVRCLRRPRGEVWTSLPARLAFALGVAMPGLADWGLRRKFGGKEGW